MNLYYYLIPVDLIHDGAVEITVWREGNYSKVRKELIKCPICNSDVFDRVPDNISAHFDCRKCKHSILQRDIFTEEEQRIAGMLKN